MLLVLLYHIRHLLVLSEHLPNSITYASAVNMTVEFDRWGEMIFVPKTGIYRKNKIAKYRYIVFDEASMVSDDMRAILLRCVSDKAKIIYMVIIASYHR